MILNDSTLSAYTERFNSLDEETVVSSINNDQACTWMKNQIPRLDCPDKSMEETYYFRWWTYRKHLKNTPEGHVVTEFLPDVPWAGRYNAISCASGHHLYEGRWLRNTGPLLDYVKFWYRGGGALHDYSNWIPDGLYKLCLTTGNFATAIELLPDLVADEQNWEQDHRHSSGLFWSSDDRDGGEFSISGPGLRTTLNCYLCANMRAIAAIAEKAGKTELHEAFINKADRLERLILDRLWDEKVGFFRCVPLQDKQMQIVNWSFGSMDPTLVVRELWGYLPWYFDLPGQGYERAFRALFEPDGFYGAYGPTTAERCHPLFGIFYTGSELSQWLDKRPAAVRQQIGERGHECLWNGPSWPFATSQAITALANHLAHSEHPMVSSEEFLQLIGRYTHSQHRVRDDGIVIPWIDENLHPDTGDWICRTRLKSWADGTWDQSKGGYERGKDYNHSTYCDVIIAGLFGIRPSADGVEIHPLLPKSGWQYACLDGVPCREHLLTVLYDKLGVRYAKGKGFRVLVDGAVKFSSDTPQSCQFKL